LIKSSTEGEAVKKTDETIVGGLDDGTADLDDEGSTDEQR